MVVLIPGAIEPYDRFWTEDGFTSRSIEQGRKGSGGEATDCMKLVRSPRKIKGAFDRYGRPAPNDQQ